MSYLNKARLSTYDNKLKEWISSQESKTITSSIYSWTKTAKASAISCYPVGGTELKPTVDFLFTETGPASVDKGPENPSTISGVSEVKMTRCGKNLCPLVSKTSSSAISIDFSSDCEFIFNGTPTSTTLVYVFDGAAISIPDYLEIGKTYTFSLYGDVSTVKFTFYRYYTTNYGNAFFSIIPGQTYTLTIPNTKSIILRFEIPANTVLNNAKFKLQIEKGSSATEFEPYSGNDYTIAFGNTYYGGSIDLATGLMTVTQFGETLNPNKVASSNVIINTNTIGVLVDLSIQHKGALSEGVHVSNKFIYANNGDDFEHFRGVGPATGWYTIRVFINKSRLDLSEAVDPSNPTEAEYASAFASWLTDNPVFVVVDRFTPATVQLTPTQILSLAQADKYTPRLNTLYTDASAVQVGYVKSPIREEYELQQAIVSQGGNI